MEDSVPLKSAHLLTDFLPVRDYYQNWNIQVMLTIIYWIFILHLTDFFDSYGMYLQDYLPCCFKYNPATWKKKRKDYLHIYIYPYISIYIYPYISKTSKMYLLHFILHDFWIILQKMKFYCQQQYIQLLTIISDKFIYMTSAFKVTSLCWKN